MKKLFVILLLVLLIPLLSGCGERTFKIVSINQDESISGAFILGSGYIDTDQCFYFYEALNDGGFQLDSAPAICTKIYEDATFQNAYVLTYRSGWFDSGKYQYRIHVPPDTIIREFTLK